MAEQKQEEFKWTNKKAISYLIAALAGIFGLSGAGANVLGPQIGPRLDKIDSRLEKMEETQSKQTERGIRNETILKILEKRVDKLEDSK